MKRFPAWVNSQRDTSPVRVSEHSRFKMSKGAMQVTCIEVKNREEEVVNYP
jgi:hypothetical protein